MEVFAEGRTRSAPLRSLALSGEETHRLVRASVRRCRRRPVKGLKLFDWAALAVVVSLCDAWRPRYEYNFRPLFEEAA
jgi:hypothetical protein